MWGDMRVDVWWYSLLVCDILAFVLFFTRKRTAKALCLCAPLALLSWFAYEQAIDIHLSQNVPIRLDILVVPFAAVFPLVPVCLYLIRVRQAARRLPPADVVAGKSPLVQSTQGEDRASPDERLAHLLKKP